MWPFKKKPAADVVPVGDVSFSVDTTERFGDNLSLGPDDWIETSPLNSEIPDPEHGLATARLQARLWSMPPRRASRASGTTSRFRTMASISPVCHIATPISGAWARRVPSAAGNC